MGLTDAECHHAHQFVLAHPERTFPDIEAMLNRGRRDGILIASGVAHAVRLVNPEQPTAVPNSKNNQPPHWRGFIPPLGDVLREQAESTAQLQRDMFGVLRDRLVEIDGSFEAIWLTRRAWFRTPI